MSNPIRSVHANELQESATAGFSGRKRQMEDGDGYAKAELSPRRMEREATAGFLKISWGQFRFRVTVPVR